MLDERRIKIYCFMVKTGSMIIEEIPVEYQEEVTNRLPNFNIADLEKIKILEDKLKDANKLMTTINTNLQGFMAWVGSMNP